MGIEKINYSNLVLILCLELVLSLMVRSFVWSHEYGFYELEMIRSFIRVVSGLFYLWLMKDLVYSGSFPSRVSFPNIAVPVFFILLPPFFVSNPGFSGDVIRSLFFCITGLFVAFKETILFLGIIQNGFSKKLSLIPAVSITSLIFSIWHYGVVDDSFYNHAQIFMASVFLGVVYRITGSLVVPIVMGL